MSKLELWMDTQQIVKSTNQIIFLRCVGFEGGRFHGERPATLATAQIEGILGDLQTADAQCRWMLIRAMRQMFLGPVFRRLLSRHIDGR
jgi:hypothetical protein